MTTHISKTKITLALKLILTIGLLYYVTSLVNFDELTPLIMRMDFNLFLAAIFLHAAAFLIMSIRWWLILVSNQQHIEYKKIFSAYYLGLFCNNFLPTTMGGDVVRIAKLRAVGIDTKQLIFSTLSDRIIGLLSIVIMGIIGVNFSTTIQETIGEQSLIIVNIVSAFVILFFLLGMNSQLRNTFLEITLGKIRFWAKLNNFIVYCHQNIEALKHNTVLPKTILLSMIAQLLIVITYYLIGISLKVDLPLLEYILIVPVVALFSSLPISVGGLGVREGILVYLISNIGVSTANAVSISLVYLAILILVTLPGGLFLLSTGHETVKKSCAGGLN